jgi:hypothetical protein
MWFLFYSNYKNFYELIKNIRYCQNKKNYMNNKKIILTKQLHFFLYNFIHYISYKYLIII